jgi:hypothetical protein
MSWQSPPSEHDQLVYLVEVELPRLERKIERLRVPVEFIASQPCDCNMGHRRLVRDAVTRTQPELKPWESPFADPPLEEKQKSINPFKRTKGPFTT